ncbi:MAG: hypothetical protein GX295_01185 [Syntrophomonadaceae bacterium]|nr:hypothetical protein [Syntrophomonadaceae bacterium]
MKDSKSLLDRISQWQQQLKECQYAGEVYIGKDELMDLASDFFHIRDKLLFRENLFGTTLVVLAVNCAYHFYDDEGFWLHFSQLLKTEFTAGQRDRLGRIIEEKLRFFGLLRTERTGPFRYVGAILEQCGVSRRHIPALARVIKEVKGYRDWDYLLNLKHKEFMWHIEGISCSAYLKNYLLDTEGWKFLLQVCYLVKLYEQGDIELFELRNLSGYQPDFWDNFLGCFRPERTRVISQSRIILKPKLLFSPAENCLLLRFPSAAYIAGMSHPEAGAYWRYPVTLLNRPELLVDYYSGCLEIDGKSTNWMITGWKPDGESVIFDIRQGFIRRGTALYPGEYYLLSPVDYDPDCHIIRDLGQMQLLGKWNYRSYQVAITPNDVIPGYRKFIDDQDEVHIYWVEPDQYRLDYSDSSTDTFVGFLPEIKLSDFTPVVKNRVGLFYTTSYGSGRIRTMAELELFRQEMSNSAPVIGRIYLGNIGRHHRQDFSADIAELQFFLIPDFQMNYEQRLYSFDEKVFLSLKGLSSIRVGFSGCERADLSGNKWGIPSGVDVAIGEVACGDYSVNLRVPVYRSRMYFTDGRPVRYLMDLDCEKSEAFILTGFPETRARAFFLGHPDQETDLIFDYQGRARISFQTLFDLIINSSTPINELMLNWNGQTVNTGAIVIKFKDLFTRIYSGEENLGIAPSSKTLMQVVRLCWSLCHQPPKEITFREFPEINPCFDEWLRTLCACASLIDRTRITIAGEYPDWISELGSQEIQRILGLYQAYKTGSEFKMGEFDLINISVIPPVERWRVELEKARAQFGAVGISAVLIDWANEVRHHRVPYYSQVANQSGGQLMSTAWDHYLYGNQQEALNLLYNLN